MSNYILIINILRVIFLFFQPSNPRNVTCDHCDFFYVNESYMKSSSLSSKSRQKRTCANFSTRVNMF